MTRALHVAADFTIPSDAVTQTFAILAKRGVGKTYTALVLVEELLKAGHPTVVVDPVGVCWGLRAAANGTDPGLPIIVMGGDHGDVPLEASAGKVVAEFVVTERQSVVLDLSLLRKGEQVRFMTDFAETLYHRNRLPLHLVLDEADAFAPQRPMHDEARMLGAVEDLIRRGRARGIGVTLVTQRAAVLNKNVLTQIEVLVVLRTISPQDRDAIEAWIRVHGTTKQGDILMASLPSLPVGTAWFWSPGWLDLFKRVEVRRRETFDSSATPKAGAKPAEPKRLADVDLEKLKSQIAATIERAKAEDPRELRRRIAELERDLKHQKTAAEPAARLIEKIREKPVPVLRDAQIKRLEDLAARVEAVVKQFEPRTADLRAAAIEIAAAVRTKLAPSINHPQAQRRVPAERPAPAAVKAWVPPHSKSAGRRRAIQAGGSDLAKGERVVLTAVAQHGDQGVTREQLSVLTGYKRSSRDTYLQRLGAQQVVQITGNGQIMVTAAGLDALGPDFAPLPTGEALREHWLRELPEGERRILAVLIEVYPKALEREVLSEQTGYLRSSRDTYLQRLRARQLVTTEGRGAVRAADTLFGPE